MMHQSSMGTVVVLLGYKLSPLWQSQLLTVFFLLTAVAMGYRRRRSFEVRALVRRLQAAVRDAHPGGLCRHHAVSVVAGVPGCCGSSTDPPGRAGRSPSPATLKPWSFWLEMAARRRRRRCCSCRRRGEADPRALPGCERHAAAAASLYRLNCYLIAYDPGDGWHYFPSVGGDPGHPRHHSRARRALPHLRQAPAGAARGRGSTVAAE